jgi:hypothetical protein
MSTKFSLAGLQAQLASQPHEPEEAAELAAEDAEEVTGGIDTPKPPIGCDMGCAPTNSGCSN